MTILKLHYDGWLALPADFRRKLGLGKGQALEAQLVGGTIVLRPAGMKAAEAVEVESGAGARARARRDGARGCRGSGQAARPAQAGDDRDRDGHAAACSEEPRPQGTSGGRRAGLLTGGAALAAVSRLR